MRRASRDERAIRQDADFTVADTPTARSPMCDRDLSRLRRSLPGRESGCASQHTENLPMNMNTIPINTLLLGAILLLLVIGAIVWMVMQRQRSRRLQGRFGTEYNRAVKEFGGRAKAERELAKREERVSGLRIVPLSEAEAARFAKAWNALQGRFVDDPKMAVAEADRLVRELMLKRGYPMGDFERRAADISVDHPAVVSNYRAAQAIAVREARGAADTEELRKAVVHYRTLFDELLEVSPPGSSAPPATRVAVQS